MVRRVCRFGCDLPAHCPIDVGGPDVRSGSNHVSNRAVGALNEANFTTAGQPAELLTAAQSRNETCRRKACYPRIMHFGLILPIVLALAGFGALTPAHSATQEVACSVVYQAEAVTEVASPPAARFFARRYPIVAPKRNAAWTCIELVERTHQGYSDAQVVFTGAVHPCAIPENLNFAPATYVEDFRSVSPVACIWRRGPPFFSLA